MLNYNNDEEVLRSLRNQNSNVFDGIDSREEDMEIRFRRKTRNPLTSHVVLRVSTKIWNRMLQAEAVLIDLQRVKVEDHSPLIQCLLCLGCGHGRRFCKETIEKCSHCGGQHMKSKCADWLAGVPPVCCNCKSAKLAQTQHNAFSSECAVRRK